MDDSTLFRAIQGHATDAELGVVERWRGASAANDAHYRGLQQLLTRTSRLHATEPTSPPSALDILAIAKEREHRGASRRVLRQAALALTGIAALVVAGVALERTGWLRRDASFGFEEMMTGDNQTVTVGLRDGSVMRLAPRSRARIRVHDGERVVHLTGRAFFSVAKRHGTPFRVQTAGGEVTVLGTQFDLDATNDDVRVVVVEGQVSLAAARGGATRVERGQAARVVEGRLQPTVMVQEPRTETRWVGRFMAFQSTSLPEVAAELARAYDARVTIADSSLREQTITSWFSDRPLPDVVRVVCAIIAAECTVAGNEVTIGKPPQ